MGYLEHEPPAPLRLSVSRLWWLRMPSPQRFERIVPIPAMHLIVNLAPEPYRVIARGRTSVDQTLEAAFLSGVQLEYLLNENPPVVHHVGAAIHPWAAGAFGIDPAAVVDRVQPAATFLTGIDVLRTSLAQVDPAEAIRRFASFLTDLRDPRWTPDHRVVAAIGGMDGDPGVPIRELAGRARMSPKGFAEAFRRATGVTPKRFSAVLRHQAFLAELPDEGDLPKWSELMRTGGYYDQPHFIHEFRRLTGMTPTAYLEHRRRYGHGEPSFLPFDEDGAFSPSP